MMESAGFHGCVASTDATHVTMMRCPISRANEHRGPNESLPARTYSIAVNHKCIIIHTTTAHPSCINDKTRTHYDVFIKSIQEQRILNDVKFLEKNNHGKKSKNWEIGVQSEWQRELGDPENADDHDYSGMGPGNDILYVDEDSINDEMELDGDNNQDAKPVAIAVIDSALNKNLSITLTFSMRSI
jgi:hypothetical protein